MHLLISHAASAGLQCPAAIEQLKLPNLTELLGLLTALPPVTGSPDSLTPLHERIRANSLGLHGADGLLPWAALDAQQLGLTKAHGTSGWAWISPCHLTAQSNQVRMDDPMELRLSMQECETLRAAMTRYFEDDGISMHALSNSTWLAFGEVFKDLPTASLERVAGSAIDPWIPQQDSARTLRRLQNEMQMLLYTHTINDSRSARGLPIINALWVSGTGTLTSLNAPSSEPLEWVTALRQAALRDDALAWQAAWESLDGTVLADALRLAKAEKPVCLSLCSDTMAVRLELQVKPWWSKLQQRFSPQSPSQLLLSL